MPTTIPAPIEADRYFRLDGISWNAYETLLDTLSHNPVRMTYHRGSLELMSPSREHERGKGRLRRMVEMMAFALQLPLDFCGSTTFRSEDLQCGLEPDECYYLANEAAVRGKAEIDLGVDPPPDLAIEIDITRSSLDRFTIYAALKVPEIWRFDGESLRIYHLDSTGTYAESPNSLSFPFVPMDVFSRFLTGSYPGGENDRLRAFLDWVRDDLMPRRGAARDD